MTSEHDQVTPAPLGKVRVLPAIKIVWRVGEAPTGRYRSFERRSWPTAEYAESQKSAASISCEDEYRPANVKTGNHKELIVRVADWSPPEPGGAAFRWRTAKQRCKTLEEAKALALTILNANPQFSPQ